MTDQVEALVGTGLGSARTGAVTEGADLASIEPVTPPVFLNEGGDIAAFRNLDAMLAFIEAVDVDVYRAYDAVGRVIELRVTESGRVVAEITDDLRPVELENALRSFLRTMRGGDVGGSLEDLVARVWVQP
jgi:hypothetical protein